MNKKLLVLIEGGLCKLFHLGSIMSNEIVMDSQLRPLSVCS
jgi:hypothetical protein